jgi:hypothetical protein
MTEPTGVTQAVAPTPAPTITLGGQTLSLADAQRSVRSSGSWFWWVAGLSVVNSVATMLEAKYGMMLGLGITQILDVLVFYGLDGNAADPGMTARVVHLVLVGLVVGFFVAIGHFARRGVVAAFVVGMLAYALDAMVFVVAADWIAVGFHAFVLFWLWGGLATQRAINAQVPAVPAAALPA